MIKRLLVANRGEIAVRIMATAAVLGIETVELPGTGAAVYLDVGAAAGMGCDMLHPGYGFLSEQPRLAERCAEAGMRFVGPAPGALALFGDKTATRARARELGLPVLAGTDADPPLEQARALLREHGAVMVKAVASTWSPARSPQRRRSTAGITRYRLAGTVTMPAGSRRATNHPGVGGQGQPVTAPPAERGDGRPVGDPAEGVDAAEPVHQVRPVRGAGQRYRMARTGLARPAEARPGGGDDGGQTGRAVTAASRTGDGCAAGGRGGRDGRSACVFEQCVSLGKSHQNLCPRTESHLTYMRDLAVTTEFTLAGGTQ